MSASREDQRRRQVEAEILNVQEMIRLNPETLQIGSIERKGGEYKIELYITTTGSYVKDPRTGQVVRHPTHHVRIDIPPTYPSSVSLGIEIFPPILFHPNVSSTGRIIIHKPLLGIVWRLWDLFNFRHVDGSNVLNREAWDWVQRQAIQSISDARLRTTSSIAKKETPPGTFRIIESRPGPAKVVNSANRQEENLSTSRSRQQADEAQRARLLDYAAPANHPLQQVGEAQDARARGEAAPASRPPQQADEVQGTHIQDEASLADQVPQPVKSLDDSGEHEKVPSPSNRPPQESIQQTPPTPAAGAGFRPKGLRVHKPERWPFPLNSWERGERRYYTSWRYDVPSRYEPGHLKIVFLRDALEKIFQHATGDLRNERFGILVGGVFTDPQFEDSWVEIVDMLPAVRVRANLASVEVSNEEISRLNQEVDGILADTGGTVRKLGWYHTHPGHGIFLSGTDQTNQRLCYTADWHVALVVDPIHKRYGAFCGPDCKALFDGVLVLSDAEAERLNTPAYYAWKRVGTKLDVDSSQTRDDSTRPAGTDQTIPEVGEPVHPERVVQPPEEPVQGGSQEKKEGALSGGLKKVASWVLKSVPGRSWIGPLVGIFCISIVALLIIAWLSFNLVSANDSLSQSRAQIQQLQHSLHQNGEQQNDSTLALIHQSQKELLAQALDAKVDLKDSAPLAYRRILRTIVRLDPTSEIGAKARELLSQPIIYTVAKGDTFSQIAKDFNVSQSDMSKLNPNVKPNAITPGQKLTIPGEQVKS